MARIAIWSNLLAQRQADELEIMVELFEPPDPQAPVAQRHEAMLSLEKAIELHGSP